jgi:ubiquinone/menaquinone biosynthesis C-methylase UbiE
MTWDVIGSFLTDSSSLMINDEIRKKMETISEYCTNNNNHNYNGNDKDNNNLVAVKSNRGGGGGCAILDVGCGDGSILSFLRSKTFFDEGRYVGVDLSSTMITKAKARFNYEKSKLKKINKTGKKEKLPTFIQGK